MSNHCWVAFIATRLCYVGCLGGKRKKINSLAQLWMLRATIITCGARYAHGCNSGCNVIWATKHFLLEFKVYFTGENIYLVQLICPLVREHIDPRGQITTTILVIGHKSSYHRNLYPYIHRWVRLSRLIREASYEENKHLWRAQAKLGLCIPPCEVHGLFQKRKKKDFKSRSLRRMGRKRCLLTWQDHRAAEWTHSSCGCLGMLI